MFSSNVIRLFWWNEIKLQGKSRENYGDLLGKYLVEKISKKEVIWTNPKVFSLFNKLIFVTVGSVLANVNKRCVVWGSGIISREQQVMRAKFLAVRGPQTRDCLLKQGYDVPKKYGDPALLLPNFFNPTIEKQYKIGIIAHYIDYKIVSQYYKNDNDILLIDLMTNDIEETTHEFLKCEKIMSSSLHGIIVAHAYGIPAIWQKFSNNIFGDDVKYQDYFESVEIEHYIPSVLSEKIEMSHIEDLFSNNESLPDKTIIEKLCTGLMEVCPFKS